MFLALCTIPPPPFLIVDLGLVSGEVSWLGIGPKNMAFMHNLKFKIHKCYKIKTKLYYAWKVLGLLQDLKDVNESHIWHIILFFSDHLSK